MTRWAIINSANVIERFVDGDAPPAVDATHIAVPDNISSVGWTYDPVRQAPYPPQAAPVAPMQRPVTWGDLVSAGVVTADKVPKV